MVCITGDTTEVTTKAVITVDITEGTNHTSRIFRPTRSITAPIIRLTRNTPPVTGITIIMYPTITTCRITVAVTIITTRSAVAAE